MLLEDVEVPGTPGRSYPPWKAPRNYSFRALQDQMELLRRLRNQVYASPFKASANQLVMIISSAPATVAANKYSCRKSRGFVVPS